MGTSTNFYMINGIRIPWNEDFYAAYDEAYDDEDTPNVIPECISGEYIILGDILADSGDCRYGFENGDQFKEIDRTKLYTLETMYKNAFISKFPKFTHLMDEPFKLIFVAHYS